MKNITVCGKNIAEFAIYYGANEPEATVFAAEELSRYIKAACGAELAIKQIDSAPAENAILLGEKLCPGLYEGKGEEDWVRACKNGLLSILIDSDECDITALGGDLALAVLATRAGFAVETDGNRLLLTAEVEMSGKGIVCAIARALLLYYLEAAYQRTRAEKKQKEGE